MSATFKDSEGREYTIRITLGLVPRLRAAGLDLAKRLDHPDTLAALDDPDRFGRIFWVLVGKQAEALGLTPEQWAEGFDGDTIASAVKALTYAHVDFSQPPAVRAAVRDAMPGAIERRNQRIADHMRTVLTGSNDSAGNGLVSPGSTPGT
jgi:hypothetical protein